MQTADSSLTTLVRFAQAFIQSMASRMTGSVRFILPILTISVLLAVSSVAFAQSQHSTDPVNPKAAGRSVATGLAWVQLTPTQQQALAPLASSWNTGMSDSQKRKWLEISKNYATLAPQAQATLTSRMNEWVALTPQQRAQARLNFGKTMELSTQLTPEEKKAKWGAYQSLSPEEKQKLAATAPSKPAGAATAIKPVPPQKLATLPAFPASQPATKASPKIIPSPVAPVPAVQPGPATGTTLQR